MSGDLPSSAGASPRGRPWALLLPALLAPSQVLFFGPALLHATNPGEVGVRLGELLAPWLLATAAVALALLAVGAVLPRRWTARWTALLLGLGVALWVQGNLLLADYGLLDGQDVDWERHAGRTPGELLVWAAALALPVVFARRVAPAAPFAAGALLVVQGVGLAVTLARAPAVEAAEEPRWGELPAALTELSRGRNVVHLLFDGFQGDVFAEVVEDDPELAAELDGFVFFAEHAGAFPTTTVSVPAMLTGERYANYRPIREFLNGTLPRRIFLRPLAAAGFRVHVATITPRFARGPIDVLYPIPKPWVSEGEHRLYAAAQLVDVALFRHLPHPLKPAIHREQSWLLQGLLRVGERRYHAGNARAFLDELTRRLAVVRAEPVYLQVHVGLPHLPVVLSGDCSFVGVQRFDRRAYTGQARCAVLLLANLLDRLREGGAYDDALVLVTSDHGTAMAPRDLVLRDVLGDLPSMAGAATALLAVKAPGAAGPLRVSRAPTSIVDVPRTVLDLVGLPADGYPGTAAMALDDAAPAARDRYYGFYRWRHEDWQEPYLRALHSFTIRGPVADGRSWRYDGVVTSPELDLGRRRLDFGSREVVSHLGVGWSSPRPDAAGVGGTWSMGGAATLLLALPREAVRLRARLLTPADNFPQTVDVSLAGRTLATWTFAAPEAYEEHVADVPADAARKGPSELVLRVARYRTELTPEAPWPLATRWERLVIEPAPRDATPTPPEENR